ncbi:MAG: protein kinase [Verrucomicrobia bacterium]|nr:protein kinase [Verrucomicrobiota bacterium]
MPSEWEQVQELFLAALEREPAARVDFVQASCAGSSRTFEEVMSLLRSHDQANHLIDQPLLAAALKRGANELEPGQIVAGYTIVSLLGCSGMGEVYLAKDNEFGRDVAIKLIKRAFISVGGVRQFEREERILASLSHPNIASFYGGAVLPNGIPYFVMEYVAGIPIDQYCREYELPVCDRLELFRKVCAAVHFAHQHLIIHRDLKPSNLLVTKDGEPKLLDFGIGKLLEANDSSREATVSLARIMTPEYASPEQICGTSVSTATDIYSLGVLLYQLLCGELPYRPETKRPDQMAKTICESEPPRPSNIADKRTSKLLKGDLENIVLMAMRKEPLRRYASVAQFSEDIRRYLTGRPVIARPDTLTYRAKKFVGRNKLAVGAALLIATALLAGIAGTSMEARRANNERDRARLAQAEAERLNAFLQNLLASADPDGMGRDVKVVQVLDAAAKKIDADLADEPAILAQAHFTIARAYASLRDGVAAENQARKALTIDQRIYGNDAPATAQVMAFLGYALRVFRRFDEAEPLLRQSLAVQRRHPPAEKRDLAKTMITLGNVLAETGRLKEAGPLIEEAVELDRKTYGDSSAEYAEALNSLGNVRFDLPDVSGAKAAYSHSIEIYRKLRPPRFYMLVPMQNLAQILLTERNLTAAESLLQETDALCRQMVGQSNPTYGNIRGFFGYLRFLQRDYHRAVPDLRRFVHDLGSVYPQTEPGLVKAELLLGLSLTRDGDAPAGEPYLRAALANGKVGAHSDFGEIEDLVGPLGECLLAQKRYSEAAPLLEKSYADLRSRRGDQDALTLEAGHRLNLLPGAH